MANPSLAMIPSGYKATKLYSVLPADGVGDFDVTRASTATRVNSSGLIEEVGVNVPRLDYSDGGCPVLLTEPQSTNLALWSEDFSNGVWINTENTTINVNVETSPDGSLTADKIIPDAVSSFHRIVQNSTIINGTNNTYSVFSKSNGCDYLVLRYNDGGGSNFNICFNVDTGIVEFNGGAGVAEIIECKDGWYNCKYTFTSSGTNGSFFLSARPIVVLSNAITAYTGDGTSGLYIWGAQLEQQSYATSYIKTEGTTVTRNADVVTGAGDVTTFNSQEGVLYAEIAALSDDDSSFRCISLNDGTSSNVVKFVFYLNNIFAETVVGGVNQGTTTYVFPSITSSNKIALKYKLNNFSLWINGVEVDTDSVGSVLAPNTLNNLSFDNGAALFFYGKTKDLRVFKTALTDSELEELTSWESFILMANGLNYTIK